MATGKRAHHEWCYCSKFKLLLEGNQLLDVKMWSITSPPFCVAAVSTCPTANATLPIMDSDGFWVPNNRNAIINPLNFLIDKVF